MSTYSYTDPVTSYTYSYTTTEPTIKDQMRRLIGDIQGQPIWYVPDDTLVAIANEHGQDLYTSAAEAAETCASRVLSLHREVQQGHRLKIQNFDPDKAFKAFMDLANMLRNKNTPSLPSYGALGGKIQTAPVRCAGRLNSAYRGSSISGNSGLSQTGNTWGGVNPNDL